MIYTRPRCAPRTRFLVIVQNVASAQEAAGGLAQEVRARRAATKIYTTPTIITVRRPPSQTDILYFTVKKKQKKCV